jgi:hypothetical protein
LFAFLNAPSPLTEKTWFKKFCEGTAFGVSQISSPRSARLRPDCLLVHVARKTDTFFIRRKRRLRRTTCRVGSTSSTCYKK